MIRGSARRQAIWILSAAAVAAVGYAFLRVPLRVQWLVARGAPPADEARSREAADALAAMGPAAGDALRAVFLARGTTWDRRAWVASRLLRAPFYAREEVAAALTAGPPQAARAAAYALLGGERSAGFGETLGDVHRSRSGLAPPARDSAAWDPAPAVPVLLEWVADGDDPGAGIAARLLGRIPPGNPAIPEALLKVVEEAPALLASSPVTVEVGLRKLVIVDCIQALLRYAPDHPDVVRRICRVVAALGDEGTEERGWDIRRYSLDLLELSRGRGMDFDAVLPLAEGPNRILRQKLASMLGEVRGPVGPTLLRLAADESPMVRRNAVASLALRKDRDLLLQVPYLVEDSFIFLRADAIRHAGDIHGVDPGLARALLPLLVSCLEEPWPGDPIPTYPGQRDPGSVEVMSSAMLTLKRLTGLHHGFAEENEIADPRRRDALAKRMLEEPALREEILAKWREVAPPRPATERLPYLVEHLSDRDPENVLRAMRELQRLTGRSDGFPPEALRMTGDDTDARNAIRTWMGSGRSKALETWKGIVPPAPR